MELLSLTSPDTTDLGYHLGILSPEVTSLAGQLSVGQVSYGTNWHTYVRTGSVDSSGETPVTGLL